MALVKKSSTEVKIKVDSVELLGKLVIPEGAKSIIVFSHGSGSSRLSPRNNFVARKMNEAGFATLLFDLLTEKEDKQYANRFDIEFLIQRLLLVTNWVKEEDELKEMKIGFFGSSTGAASALGAASMLGQLVGAVVSRGGRPDLASPYLSEVMAPSLLIVGDLDHYVVELNESAYNLINAPKEVKIVKDATHLFEEPGKLGEVAGLAAEWFKKYLKE